MYRKITVLAILFIVVLLAGCKPKTFTATLNKSLDTVEVGSTWVDAGCETDGTDCVTIKEDVDTTTIGVYEVFYQATKKDATMYLKRVVTVVDTIKPVITLQPGVDTIQLHETWVNAGCTATDNYDDSVTCSEQSSTLNTAVVGEYIITYVAVDSSGNSRTMERHVFIIE